MSECWVWARTVTNGYGITPRLIAGRRPRVHRYVYEHAIGPIPPGCDLHHTCGNRACYNPTHLVPLTKLEHVRLHAGDHCKRCGTTYSPKADGKRYCKNCQNMRHRKYRASGHAA